MKVILLDDVARVGHEGEILEVANGYFRNYLEPRNLAVRATKGALRDLETRSRAIERRDEDKRAHAQELVEGLREQKVVIRASTGEGTRLHGSVTAQQIAEAAREQISLEIDRRDIDIPDPIRETGDYLVSAKVYKDVTAQLAVSVLPIDAEKEEQPAAERAEAEAVPEPKAEAAQEAVEESQQPVEDEAEGEEDE